MGNTSLKKAFFFFLACFFAASIFMSYERSLCETLEAESALIAQAFYKGETFFINHLNGQEDLDKPPGYYYVIAACHLFCPNWELSARLPSILSAALFIFLFSRLTGYEGSSKMFFILLATIFLSCPKIIWMSQIARMDLFFSLLCFTSIFFFIKAWRFCGREQSPDTYFKGREISAFFFFAAMAVMVKGPVGAILVFVPVSLFLLLEKKSFFLRKLFFSPSFLIFLIFCLPWFIYATIKTDFRFFHRFILEENLSRFTSLFPGGGFKEFNHSPLSRYFVYFLTGFFPWSLITPFALFSTLRTWAKRSATERLFFVYFVFVFVFFTLATSKRSDYILPLYPAAAYLCAVYVLRTKKGDTILSIITYFLTGVAFLSGITFCLFAPMLHAGRTFAISHYLSILLGGERLAIFVIFLLKENLLTFFVLLISSLFCIHFLMKTRKQREITLCLLPFMILTGLVTLLFGTQIGPAIYKGKDVRPFCKYVRNVVGKRDLYYAGFWDEECTFYLGRKIQRVDLDKAVIAIHKKTPVLFFILDTKRYERLRKLVLQIPYTYSDPNLLLRQLVLISNTEEPKGASTNGE